MEREGANVWCSKDDKTNSGQTGVGMKLTVVSSHLLNIRAETESHEKPGAAFAEHRP
jgi:hypothetical protein